MDANTAPQSQEAPPAGQESATVDANTAPQSQGEGSQPKRQRKSANPRQLIPKSLQKERLQEKCLKKGLVAVPQGQAEIQDRLIATLYTKLSTSITDLTRVTPSPPANYIKSAKDMNKIMGLARQVLSGNQPDWNVVTKDIPISPDLLHTYNQCNNLQI
ncbi:Protein FAM38A [Sesbania bispinosa]|nr:Protein FAM38A [Sesbania bispinosa]